MSLYENFLDAHIRVSIYAPMLVIISNVECVCIVFSQVRAFNLYHSAEGDLALREEALRRYLPQVPFIDHSPQQLPHDEEFDVPVEELLRGLSVVQTEGRQQSERLYLEAPEHSAVVV